MAHGIELQPAYLLHSTPFRDTSMLLDFITRDFGRIRAVARGVRKAGSSTRGLLQPFIPLQVSLAGRHELKNLRQVELLDRAPLLRGESLYSALYVNELMVRLIHGHESDPALFAVYERTLGQLAAGNESLEAVLRRFELTLLETLGYGIPFESEAGGTKAIQPEHYYCFQLESGFSRVAAGTDAPRDNPRYFPGEALIRIARGDLSSPDTRRYAKRLLRYVLNAYLGDKPLKSRQFFLQHRRSGR